MHLEGPEGRASIGPRIHRPLGRSSSLPSGVHPSARSSGGGGPYGRAFSGSISIHAVPPLRAGGHLTDESLRSNARAAFTTGKSHLEAAEILSAHSKYREAYALLVLALEEFTRCFAYWAVLAGAITLTGPEGRRKMHVDEADLIEHRDRRPFFDTLVTSVLVLLQSFQVAQRGSEALDRLLGPGAKGELRAYVEGRQPDLAIVLDAVAEMEERKEAALYSFHPPDAPVFSPPVDKTAYDKLRRLLDGRTIEFFDALVPASPPPERSGAS
jgi:hypothetical protein